MPLAFLLRGARHASHDIFFCAPLQSAGDYIRCKISHRKICGIFRIYIGMLKRDLFYFLMVTFFAVLHAVQICLPLESLLKALTLT